MAALATLAGWFAALAPAATNCSLAQTVFQDRSAELGLRLAPDSACWADFDNDGWVDLCASGGVWRNDAGRGFIEMAKVGPSVAADYDNDGFVDLFSWPARQLFRNQEGKGFAEVPLPELPRSISLGACWGDFNGDGFVDLYVGGYEDWDADVTWPSMLLINERGTGFRLAWSESRHRTRGVTACDFDQDGDLDVYASNYRLQPNQLWRNDGAGQFEDVAEDYNALATSAGFPGGHSIGAAWGDFDGDGLLDLFAGNFAHQDDRGDQPKSRFLKNLGAERDFHLEDRGECGVFYQESYATPAAGDYDNDGNLDLFFTTVYGVASFGRNNFPTLFHNDGGFAFGDGTAAAHLGELGPTTQAAWADYDNDGDLDLATAGKLFQNQGTPNRWLKLKLEGDGTAVNRSAIGAQARIRIGDRVLTRQVEAGTGEGNQNDLVLHFGLGQHDMPLEAEVVWPGGRKQLIPATEANRQLTVRYSPGP